MIMIEHYDMRVLIKYYNDNDARRFPSGDGDRREKREIEKKKSENLILSSVRVSFFHANGLYVR